MNICLYSDLHWEFGKPSINIPEEADGQLLRESYPYKSFVAYESEFTVDTNHHTL